MKERALSETAKSCVRAALLIATVCVLTITGCSSQLGKGSQSGTGTAPEAVITPIGNMLSSAAGVTPVTLTVRSGADVLMSGKDSDGHGIALSTLSGNR
jgi:hypothetical protein